MTLRQQVHARYQQLVQDRIDAFRDMIAALAEDSRNDAKGSAGDKHETSLSMMHIEQEKLNRKLQEFLDQKAVLDRIDPNLARSKIALGSIVVAGNHHLFLSAALPKTTIDGKAIIALSVHSPLGASLIGMQVGDTFAISGTDYKIAEIL